MIWMKFSNRSEGNVEIRHLRLVTAVAQAGSLTKAGEKLHLTQSALSHQLKEVESELNTPLFYRLNKKMVLTPAGKIVLHSAGAILTDLERTKREVQRLISGEAGLLRISTECYTCYHWLPNLLRAYNAEFPNVEVQIVAEATRKPIAALYAGKLDVAIGYSKIDGIYSAGMGRKGEGDHKETRAGKRSTACLRRVEM